MSLKRFPLTQAYWLIVLSLTYFSAITASAAGVPAARGPIEGSDVTFAAPLVGSDGAAVSLKDLHGEKGTVLVFSRSLNWCPYCKSQAADLIEKSALLTDLGYNIAIITYDAPEKLADYAAKNEPSFPLLSDPQSQTIIAWGLRNEKYEPGSFAYGIPHPIIIVVGTDNKVAAKFAEEGYKTRPAVEQVAKALAN